MKLFSNAGKAKESNHKNDFWKSNLFKTSYLNCKTYGLIHAAMVADFCKCLIFTTISETLIKKLNKKPDSYMKRTL